MAKPDIKLSISLIGRARLGESLIREKVFVPSQITTIDTDEKEILLRFNDQRRTAEAYKSIVILGGKKSAC